MNEASPEALKVADAVLSEQRLSRDINRRWLALALDAHARETARQVWMSVADFAASGTPTEGILLIARSNARALLASSGGQG